MIGLEFTSQHGEIFYNETEGYAWMFVHGAENGQLFTEDYQAITPKDIRNMIGDGWTIYLTPCYPTRVKKTNAMSLRMAKIDVLGTWDTITRIMDHGMKIYAAQGAIE